MAVREKEGGGSVAVDWRRMCEAGGHRLQRRAAVVASPARPWNCPFSLPYFVVVSIRLEIFFVPGYDNI